MRLEQLLKRNLSEIHFFEVLSKKLPYFQEFVTEVLVMYENDELFTHFYEGILLKNKFFDTIYQGGLITETEYLKHSQAISFNKPIHIDFKNKYIIMFDTSIKIKDLVPYIAQLYYKVNNFIWWHEDLKPYLVFDWFLITSDFNFDNYINLCYFFFNDIEEAFIRLEEFIKSQPNFVHLLEKETPSDTSLQFDEDKMLQASLGILSHIVKSKDLKLVTALINTIVPH
jgi:hypothetical protein